MSSCLFPATSPSEGDDFPPTPAELQPPLQVVIRYRRDETILRIQGEVDLATATELSAALAIGLAVGAGNLLVDLREVTFIDCAGMAALTQAARQARAESRTLHIVPGASADALVALLGGWADVPDSVLVADVEQQTPGGNSRRDEYAHLTPLFAERVQLPAEHPRQQVLRAELIKGYLPVAQHIARRHRYRGENLDDLEQVATLGLINAVDRFEPERGFDFLSFAIPTINGEVQRHYRDRTSTIRVPRPIKELQSRLYQAADEMSQRIGRAATPSELARHLNVGLDTVIEALQAAYETRLSSLDEPQRGDDAGFDEGTRFADALGAADPELDLVENRESLGPLLDGLPERERKIILLRFYGNMTQTEIANRIGISQMHVSRLLTLTLAQLRRQLTEK